MELSDAIKELIRSLGRDPRNEPPVGEECMEQSEQVPIQTPKQKPAKLIPAFNVRDVDKIGEIAAAVQDAGAAEGIGIHSFVKICPESAEQEKIVRDALAGMGVEYERSSVQMAHFLICGLLPTTREQVVTTELRAAGISARRVSQMSNGSQLLPLFAFDAPTSQTLALQQLGRLCDREVQIQSYSGEKAPLKQQQGQISGSQAQKCSVRRQFGCCSNTPSSWKRNKSGLKMAQALHHAAQQCSGMPTQGYRHGNAPYPMRGNCPGPHATIWSNRPSVQDWTHAPCGTMPNSSQRFCGGVQFPKQHFPSNQGHMFAPRANCSARGQGDRCCDRPNVQECTNGCSMMACRPGPIKKKKQKKAAVPSRTLLQTLSVLQDLQNQFKTLNELPQQIQSLFQGNPLADSSTSGEKLIG